MSHMTDSEPHWHPYDKKLWDDPHPMFRRIREEKPLYYNAEHDFYALSRYHDCETCLADRDSYINVRGDVLDFVKANITYPRGLFICEDPPQHTVYRGVLTKVFTPAKMGALEAEMRELTIRCLDPLVGTGKIDFIEDLGKQVPARVMGMLLGLPEDDLKTVRTRAEATMRSGKKSRSVEVPEQGFTDEFYANYIDWRMKNPSDDLMTQLIRTEFVDDQGVKRLLARDEVVTLVTMLAGAGIDTTNRLIGWMGKLLGEHPDQRRQIVQNRALIPQTIEEVLRYEPPSITVARYVAKDVQIHDGVIPADSALLCFVGAANRDPRQYDNPEEFDINRERRPHLGFGYGFHACLGNALARVEGRVVLDEILNRFPDWELDMDNAVPVATTFSRGWEAMPAFTN
jgi:cytochrome P450